MSVIEVELSRSEWPVEARWLEFTALVGSLAAALLEREGYASGASLPVRGGERPTGESVDVEDLVRAVLAALMAVADRVGVSAERLGSLPGTQALRRATGDGHPKKEPAEGRRSGSQEEQVHRTMSPAWVAARLLAGWEDREAGPIFVGSLVEIDLRTLTGQWELLALAVLLAAKVKERVAETAFLALREAGLLDLARLARGGLDERQAIFSVLREHYGGPISKEAKADALCANARRLVDRWGGDLSAVYRAAEGDDRLVVAELQRFQQLHSRALWLCRVMTVYGGWSMGSQATRFLDAHVRRVLGRLGFVTEGSRPWSASQAGCWEVIERYFDGDTTALYRHGKELCAADDLAVCRSRCGLLPFCSFWNQADPTRETHKQGERSKAACES